MHLELMPTSANTTARFLINQAPNPETVDYQNSGETRLNGLQ